MATGNDPLKGIRDSLSEIGIDTSYQFKPYKDFSQPMPISKDDHDKLEPQPYGLPDDWDYRTADRSPDGKPLPKGAVGFTPYGDVWYGGNSAIENWWNGISSRWNRDVEDTEERVKRFGEAKDSFFDNLFSGNLKDAGKNFLQGALEIPGIITNLGGEDEDESDGDDTKNPTFLTHLGRAVGEAVGGGLALLSEVAEETEQIRGGLVDAAEGSALGESVTTKGIRELGDTWFTSLLYSIDLVGFGWDAFRAITNPDEEKWDKFKKGYEAGRILYTTWQNEAVRAEYDRRYQAGENPYLLAEELQNPGKELAGEILADPLNLIGLITKPLRAAGVSGRVEKLVATIGDDAIKKVFQGVDRISDTGVAGEKLADLVRAVPNWSADLSKRLKDVAEEAGLLSLTTPGKRGFYGQLMGGFVNSVSSIFVKRGSPNHIDETLDVLKAIMGLHGSADEIAESVAYLGKTGISPNIIYSDASGMFGKMMRDVLSDSKGKFKPNGFINKLKKIDNEKEFFETFASRIDKATIEAFPTLAKRVEDGEKLNAIGRAVLRFEKLADSGPVRGLNNFFANIYMGLSPGYVARNYLVDTVTTFVDEGIGAGLRRIAPWGPSAADRGSIKWLGQLPPAANQAQVGAAAGAVGVKRTWGPMLDLAQNSERATSSVLVYHGVRRTMQNSINAMFKDAAEDLVRANVDDTLLKRLMLDNHGNAREAVNDYIRAIDGGGYDPFVGMRLVADEDVKTLEDFGRWDNYLEHMGKVPETATVEEKIAAHDKFFKEYIEDFAAKADKEAGALIEGTVGASARAGEGPIAMNVRDLANKQRNQNTRVEEEVQNFLNTLVGKVEALPDSDDKEKFMALLDKNLDITSSGEGSAYDKLLRAHDKQWRETNDLAMDIARGEVRDLEPDEMWKLLKLPGKAPEGIDDIHVLQYYWEGHYYPAVRPSMRRFRERLIERAQEVYEEIATAPGGISPMEREWEKVASEVNIAQLWDQAIVVNHKTRQASFSTFDTLDNYTNVKRLGLLNGIATATPDGTATPTLLRTINKYQDPKLDKWDDLAEVPFSVAQDALKKRAEEKGILFKEPINVPKNPDNVGKLNPFPVGAGDPHVDNAAMPSAARVFQQQLAGLRKVQTRIADGITENHGRLIPVNATDATKKGLEDFVDVASLRMEEARVIASRVGKEVRDFALHDYSQRKNLDLAAGLIYPYQFWHSRTYKKWFTSRVATNPGTVAAYAKYKDTLAEIHAGAPDWWKYNLNSNELFGLFPENPLFFNLEASLNPVRGLVDVDFEDRYKRVNWWTSMLDDLNKFGPSTWTPFSIAAALSLQAAGEDEAASRWGGRLIPQTQTVEALLNIGERGVNLGPIKEGGEDVEIGGLGEGSLDWLDFFAKDPAVSLFSNGIDPYTRRRVGRALGAMVEERLITKDQAIEAAYSQSGEHWEAAHERAVNERAPGQLSSFFLGVGFKARTVSDLKTDQFYDDYYRLWALRDTMAPGEFRETMNALEDQYPFMETVLLSAKAGESRDTALAYNLLRRLPPGGSRVSREIGIHPDLLSKFYDSKGDWEDWSTTEKDRFMSGIVDMMAVLKTPEDGTRQEWNYVKSVYGQMLDLLENRYGSDIHRKVDVFYQLRNRSQSEGNRYLEQNPDVEAALDEKAYLVAQNELLATYYGGVEAIDKYYSGLMYEEIESQLGKDIWDLWDQYYQAPDRRAFWKANPELQAYSDIRRRWQVSINRKVSELGSKLPEPKVAEARPDLENPNIFQQEFLNELNDADPQTYTTEDWDSLVGGNVVDAVADFVQGAPLPSWADKIIENFAEEEELDKDNVIQLIGVSVLKALQ